MDELFIRSEATVGAQSAQWSILNKNNARPSLPLFPAQAVNCTAKPVLFD